jgi:hypothetical protein
MFPARRAYRLPTGTEFDNEIERLFGRRSPLLSCAAIVLRRDREMPHRTLARLFDPLARQLARRSAPQTSDPQSAEITDKRSDPPNERPKALEPNVVILLYLVSLGFVAIATVVVFFGVGFLLLAHRNEELIAGPDARNRVVKIEPRPPDLAQPPDKNGALSTTQTASASPVLPTQMPEPHYDILPLARSGTAVGSAPAAETGAANGMSHASSGQNQPGLRSNTAEAATRLRRLGLPTRKRRGAVGIATLEREGIGPGHHALDLTGLRQLWSVGLNGRGIGSSSLPPTFSLLYHPHLHGKLGVLKLPGVLTSRKISKRQYVVDDY